MIKHGAGFFTLFIYSFVFSMNHEHYRLNAQEVTKYLISTGMSEAKIQYYRNYIIQPPHVAHISKILAPCGSETFFVVLHSGEKILCTKVSHGQFANQAIGCIFNLQANPPFCPIPIPDYNFHVLKICYG